MRTALAHALRRRALCALTLAGVLVGTQTHPASATFFPLEAKDVAADRAERKRLNSSGKPLPGTPELGNLEERLSRRGLPTDASMFIRIFKAESELEVWMSRGGGGTYALFAKYPICNCPERSAPSSRKAIGRRLRASTR